MPGLSVVRSIAAPPEKVWAVFTDLKASADRLSAVKAVEVFTAGPFGVGTRWRETRTMFGREATEDMEITAVDPGRSYTAEAASHGSHYTSRFDFAPTEDGTDVTFSFTGESHGAMRVVGAVMWPMLKGKMAKELRRDLDDLAVYCERT
jgi:uncharacterized protein YndB with AHSA1/START domain